jgi:hypothetical protein
MRKLRDGALIEHYSYKGYLIRWTHLRDTNVWVEKDHAFICWANDIDDAKVKIDELVQ